MIEHLIDYFSSITEKLTQKTLTKIALYYLKLFSTLISVILIL